MKFEKAKCTAVSFQRGCRPRNLKSLNALRLYFQKDCRAQNMKNLNARQKNVLKNILSTNIIIYKTCFSDGNVLNTKYYILNTK